jgi:hypothetical protein
MRKTSSTAAKKPKKKAPKGLPVVLNIDPKTIVEACRQNEDSMFNGMLEIMGNDETNSLLGGMMKDKINVVSPDGKEVSFAAVMALQSLIMQEEKILRLEPKHEELQAERERYVGMRKVLKEKLGKDFDSFYGPVAQGHNDCARMNLDNSKGMIYCYVLPRFNDDGSHGPVGDKDYPWAMMEKPTC